MALTDRPFATTPYEHAFGSILMRAHPPDVADCRNAEENSEALASTFAQLSPLVARVEAFGDFSPGGVTVWSRKAGPGGRYTTGTSQGGLCISPPDWGIENTLTGTQPPSTSPTPHLILWGSRLGFGIPTTTGLTGSGFTVRYNGASGANELIVDTVNASGTASATQAFKLDSANSIAYVYGQQVLTGSTTGSAYNKTTTAGVGPFTTTETIVATSNPIPANTLKVGSSGRVNLSARVVVGATPGGFTRFRLRFGTTGTTADASVGTIAFPSDTTGGGQVKIICDFAITVAGASGKILAQVTGLGDGSAAGGFIGTRDSYVINMTGSTTFDTTLASGILSASLQGSSIQENVSETVPSTVEFLTL